jgi:integrase
LASVTSRKLPSGTVVWRVQFRIDGQPKEETFRTWEAAESFGKAVDRKGGQAAREERNLRSHAGASGEMTVREWTERYLNPANGMLGAIGSGTIADYWAISKRSFLPFLGELPLSAVDRIEVSKWVAWQELQTIASGKRPLAAKTVSNYHGLLSSVLAAAVDHGFAAKNHAHGVKLTRGVPREAVFLSEREVSVLVQCTPEFYRPVIIFLVATGARWAEASAAEWGDFNFEAKPVTWNVRRAWKLTAEKKWVLGPPKTAKGRRTIAIDEETVEALGARGRSNERIFIGRRGAEKLWHGRFLTSTWNPSVARAQDPDFCASLGLAPIFQSPTPHDLRHTHASLAIANGVSMVELQRRLGHSSITVTLDRYTHLSPGHGEKTALTFGRIMKGILTTGPSIAAE